MTELESRRELTSALMSDALNRFQVMDPALRRLTGLAWIVRTMAVECASTKAGTAKSAASPRAAA